MNERIGVLAALLSSTLGGTVAATTRFAVADLDPLTLAALRFGGAFVVLLPIALVARQPWPEGRDWIAVVLLGGVYFCVYQVFYNVAFVYTTAAHGSMIGSLLALITMVVAATFGVERLTARKTAGVLMATGGVAAALAAGLADAPGGAWRGDLLMLAGVVCWACYNVWSRPFIARSSPLTFLIGGMGVGAGLLVAVGLWRGAFHAAATLTSGQWGALLYMALVATPLALWLWIVALRSASSTRIASTMAMHPIAAAILAAMIIGEPMAVHLVVGIGAVFAGIWIAAGDGSDGQKNEQGQSPARVS